MSDKLYRWASMLTEPPKDGSRVLMQYKSYDYEYKHYHNHSKDWFIRNVQCWLCEIEVDQDRLWGIVSDKFQSWIDNDFDERAASEVAEQELKPKYTITPKQ